MKKYRLAIFASGQGTNAENIMNYFENHSQVQVVAVVTNNPKAGVIARANTYAVRVEIINNEDASDAGFLSKLCENIQVDYIALAGYLRKIPYAFAQQFDKRILNVHPSLLPKFGGKGMYGDHVHRAVLLSGDKASGITVHFVNAAYDEGEIVGQAECFIQPDESVETLKQKIGLLERMYYPQWIEETMLKSTLVS